MKQGQYVNPLSWSVHCNFGEGPGGGFSGATVYSTYKIPRVHRYISKKNYCIQIWEFDYGQKKDHWTRNWAIDRMLPIHDVLVRIRMRNREAQKHTDSTEPNADPDSQHYINLVNLKKKQLTASTNPNPGWFFIASGSILATKISRRLNKPVFSSMTFWCGSESADPYLCLTDPDPALFVIDFQDLNRKIIF
jgi:hypothetical protein